LESSRLALGGHDVFQGVIYMHPLRLGVDLSTVGAVDSVKVWSWVVQPDDLRMFLYQGDSIIEQVASDWYGGSQPAGGNLPLSPQG